MRFALLPAVLTGVFTQMLSATTVVYFNQAQWQAAMNARDSGSLSVVSFAAANWTESLQLTPTYTDLVSQSKSITADSGYAEPGLQDNSTLGHVSNGVWTDAFGKYGSTTFHFAQSLYGFGGDFDIKGKNGLNFFAGGSSFISPNGTYDGFIGLVSDQPLDSLLISYGQNGCPQVFGNSYTLSNFELATSPLATPEPNLQYAFCGLVVLAIGRIVLKRC